MGVSCMRASALWFLEGRLAAASRAHFDEKQSMSTTSIEARSLFPAIAQNSDKHVDQQANDSSAALGEPRLLEILSLSGWRTLLLETVALLALLAALRHWIFGFTQIPGVPHPYWLPVLLAASQY